MRSTTLVGLMGLVALAALTASCQSTTAVTPPDAAPPARKLPAGFLFGTAIAGFQVDMGCPTLPATRCTDPGSDWYTWVTDPSIIADASQYISGDAMDKGPGFYELYPQDLDRVSGELHGNTLRLSLEWSRIFPTSTAGIEGYDQLHAVASTDALAFYHALFASLKAHGLVPFVTINHYTLPTWIHDAKACHQNLSGCAARGWVDADEIVPEIAKYAGFVAQEFGGEVDLWATENEPMGMLVSAYIFESPYRSNPPGAFLAVPEFKQAYNAMIAAHARMYDAVHAADIVDADGDGKSARVGIVYSLSAAAPQDPANPLDVAGAQNFHYLMNQVFLDGVIKGDLDATLDGTPVHKAELANRCDFLGVNYYTRVRVKGTQDALLPNLSSRLTFDFTSAQTDENYPQGLDEVLAFANGYGIPMFISETGHDDPADDGAGGNWIVDTVGAVERALDAGMPIEGYYYWTLMDLFEWNHGFAVKGGLYFMDSNDPTRARRPKKSVEVFRRIADAGGVPPDLASH